MPDIYAIRVKRNNQVQVYEIYDRIARNGHFIGDVYTNANPDYTGGNKLPDENRVNALISAAISDISGISTTVVQERPTVGEPNIIYFIPHEGDDNDIYDEFMYINNSWELIGTTQVDISSKADKEDTVLDTTLSMGRAANSTIGSKSTALGNNVTASGNNSQAFGASTLADGFASHAEGASTASTGYAAHAEGQGTTASGRGSHAEGGGASASGDGAHAEGTSTTASGQNSHAEGAGTNAIGHQSHAEGVGGSNKSYYYYAYVNGQTVQRSVEKIKTGAEGFSSHSEGNMTTASGQNSHAEGIGTIAHSDHAHAEGYETYAGGSGAHAEGNRTTASAVYSHAEGNRTIASAVYSHAEGSGTIANHASQHVSGEYNIADPSLAEATERGTYAEIIGNGTNDGNRSNARTLDWNGNEELSGDLTVNKGTANEVSLGALKGAIKRLVIPTFTRDMTSQNPNVYTCDMQWNEVEAAINNKTCNTCEVLFINSYGTSNDYLTLLGIHGEDSDCIEFESVTLYGTETRNKNIKFYDNGTVEYTYGSINLNTKADRADTVLDTTLSRGRKANSTVGTGSFAFGDEVRATGNYSHAEGSDTVASGEYAHAEGSYTTASYGESHAEGSGSIAGNNCAHAEGNHTTATGHAAHAEGNRTEASGAESHSEGDSTQAIGYASHSEGEGTIANANASHVGGQYNVADEYGPEWEEWTPNKLYHVGDKVKQIFAWGSVYYICSTENSDSEFIYGHWEIDNYRMNYVEIIGNGTDDDNRSNARSLDWKGNEHLAGDVYVHANADGSGGSKLPDEARVNSLIATAVGSITGFDAEVVQALPQTGTAGTIYLVPKQGSGTDVHDEYIYVNDAWELIGTTQIDISNKADKANTVLDTTLSRGRKANTTVGTGSFAFGNNVEASGNYSHAEGNVSSATGPNSHAEGYLTVASSDGSHAEGNSSRASGLNSHAEGLNTNAMGNSSHAEGYSTQENNDYKPRSYDISNDTTTFTVVNKKPGAAGSSSHSEGYLTVASGLASHAEGGYTFADGDYAHAEGSYTNATGERAHSEGYNTTASGSNSHAEGSSTIASNLGAHAEGGDTVAYGMYSHAEGFEAKATGAYSHAEGYHTKTAGVHTHAEGYRTTANAEDSHAEGQYSETNGRYSHAEGLFGRVNSNGSGAHSEGYGSATNRDYPQYNAPVDRTANFNGRTQPGTSINLATGAHAQGAHNEGTYTTANANSSHAEGYATLVTSDDSHAEGLGSIVTGGPASHAEGKYTYASGSGGAHAEGQYTIAQGGGGEHAEGMYTSSSGGGGTHAEGFVTSVSGGNGSHAEGHYVYGSGNYGFHIEGDHTECSVGNGAHTEGYYSKSFGRDGSHTEGYYTIGRGEGSHTGGRYNVANSCNNLPDWEPNKLYHVGDKVKHLYPGYESYDALYCRTEHTSGSEFNSLNWNYEYADNGYAEIIGNGTADDARANARALDWEGNEHLAGNLYVGCNPDSTGGTKVLTENDLEYTTEADALKIISDFWNEDEEDEGMLVTATYVNDTTNNIEYYETDKTALEIKQAFQSGKNVVVKFASNGVGNNDLYAQLTMLAEGYSAPQGRSDYPYEYADGFVFGGGSTQYYVSATASHASETTNSDFGTTLFIGNNWVDPTTGKLRFEYVVQD